MLRCLRVPRCLHGYFTNPEKASAPTVLAFPPNSRGFFVHANLNGAACMHPDDEKVLKIAKEIVVKFIEIGRVSPGNFDQQFRSIFWTLKNTIVSAQIPDLGSEVFRGDNSGEE